MVRCPVCDSTTVTVVLNSKPRASCACCGAQWIQEGSWQRSVRPGQSTLPMLTSNGNGHGLAPILSLEDEVIALPDPVKPPRLRSVRETPAGEAIAT